MILDIICHNTVASYRYHKYVDSSCLDLDEDNAMVRQHRAFTLIELLVVIAIILLLMRILMLAFVTDQKRPVAIRIAAG